MATQRYRMEMTWTCPGSVYYIYWTAPDGNTNGSINVTKGNATSRNNAIAAFIAFLTPGDPSFIMPGYSNASLTITENGNSIHFLFDFEWDLSASPLFFIGYFVLSLGYSGTQPACVPVPYFPSSSVTTTTTTTLAGLDDVESGMIDEIWKLLMSERNGTRCIGERAAKVELGIDMVQYLAAYRIPGQVYDGITWTEALNCMTLEQTNSIMERVKSWLSIAACDSSSATGGVDPLAGITGVFLTTVTGDYITAGGAYVTVS